MATALSYGMILGWRICLQIDGLHTWIYMRWTIYLLWLILFMLNLGILKWSVHYFIASWSKNLLYSSFAGLGDDYWIWTCTRKGCLLLSIYSNVRRGPVHNEKGKAGWKVMWGLVAPPKVKTISWKLLWNHFPTSSLFARILHSQFDSCSIWKIAKYSIRHIFFDCPFARNDYNLFSTQTHYDFKSIPRWHQDDWLLEGQNQSTESTLVTS